MQSNSITKPRTQDILWRYLKIALQQEFKEQGVQPISHYAAKFVRNSTQHRTLLPWHTHRGSSVSGVFGLSIGDSLVSRPGLEPGT